jgi:uncharacterized protein involved in type VI secretion and phage assembly
MPYTLFGEPVLDEEQLERRINGVAIAKVESNKDIRGEGRVLLSFPWAPGITAWARVATPFAGMNRGMYFMPQERDEVLVAFQNGDMAAPYVIGALWSPVDRPPIKPGDIISPSTKRIIRTGTALAHEIVLDDVEQSVTITSSTKQQIRMDPKKITLSTVGGTASITLETSGKVSITGAISIDLKAPKITLTGGTVSVNGQTSTKITGGASCSIQAGKVLIN